MKHWRNTLLSILALSLLLSSSSCATAPEKKSPDDCLVLIPTVVTNTSGTVFARKYFAQFAAEPGQKPKEIQISDSRSSYLMIVATKPGMKLVGIRSEVDRERNFRGPDGFNAVDIALPYEPGRAVVAPFGIELVMVRLTSQDYTSGVQLMRPTDVQREEILEKFRNNDQNEGWFQ